MRDTMQVIKQPGLFGKVVRTFTRNKVKGTAMVSVREECGRVSTRHIAEHDDGKWYACVFSNGMRRELQEVTL